MANKDYKQMIQRGKWLENFLKPKLKSWGHKQLALQFIDMYQVEFKLSKNDLSIHLLEMLDENPQKNYVKLFHNFDPPLHRVQINHIDRLFKIKNVIRKAFQDIISNTKPWDYHFSESKIKAMQKLQPGRFGFFELVYFYDGLSNRLYIDENGLKRKNVFYAPEFSMCYAEEKNNKRRPSCFPWVVAASRIFFDFLFLGGREYFLFCKHCDNFSTIERKGRKKFCSDICKTRFRISNLA